MTRQGMAMSWCVLCALALWSAGGARAQPLETMFQDGYWNGTDPEKGMKHLLHRKEWFLMMAGSSAPDAPPPKQMCIRVYVTETNRTCNCVINTYNHTVHEVKIYKVLGIDQDNVTEVYTLAPSHARFPTTQRSGLMTAPSLIKGATCWRKGTRKLWPFHYTTWGFHMNGQRKKWKDPQSIHKLYNFKYLVGINTRKPTPEYHTMVLSPFNPSTFTKYLFYPNLPAFHMHYHTNFLPPLERRCYYTGK